MTLREEFSRVLAKCSKVYIFGTGEVADRLYELIKEYDGIYVESSNNVCMRIDDLWYDFYVMKRTSIDTIYYINL